MGVPNHIEKYSSEEAFTAIDWNNSKGHTKKHKFPEKYIIAYFPYSKNYFLKKHPSKTIKLYCWLKIHVHKDIGFVLMAGAGAPHAGSIMEELVALGGKYFINTGTAGGLHQTGIVLCSKALMDDGFSHHYIKNGKYSYPSKKLTSQLEDVLKKKHLKYGKGPTWTIDAPYRETRAEFERYKKEGIYTVEMEASALFTVGTARKVDVASVFVVSDVLFDENAEKFHRFDTKQGQRQIIDAAYDCLRNIGKSRKKVKK